MVVDQDCYSESVMCVLEDKLNMSVSLGSRIFNMKEKRQIKEIN